MKKSLLAILSLVSLTSCIYDFKADIEEASRYAIVEGDIQVGGITTVSYTWAGSTNVQVVASVEGEDGTVVTGEKDSGICTVDTRALDPAVRYRLRVQDLENDAVYVSSWEDVQPAPVLDSLSYTIHDNVMDLKATFHSDTGMPYYCLAYREQWEYRSYATTYLQFVEPLKPSPTGGRELFPDPLSGLGYEYGRIFYMDDLNPYHTCWAYPGRGRTEVVTAGAMATNKMENYTFKTIENEDLRTSVKYRVMVVVRMLSQNTYDYWKSMDDVSSQTGDLFSPVPSLRRGNIVNEAQPDALVLGYIGASRVASSELWISAQDVDFYRQPASVQKMLEDDALGKREPFGVAMEDMYRQYKRGYRPWLMVTPSSGATIPETYYVWIKERCLDCRIEGGTTTKPDGWE